MCLNLLGRCSLPRFKRQHEKHGVITVKTEPYEAHSSEQAILPLKYESANGNYFDGLLKLYKTLHPKDTDATEDTLDVVTIDNVLTDNLYNDLGIMAGNNRMLLEAQASWTVNILIRILLYLAQSYHEYFERTSQSPYKSKKVKMPKPELCVIYTGSKGRKPDTISLSQEFFDGADIDIEIKAKVIYENDKDNIINEYIVFCKVFNEQIKEHGMTKQAVTETIRICKDRNILKQYLSSKEVEVVTIMMSLFDNEQIMRTYTKDLFIF